MKCCLSIVGLALLALARPASAQGTLSGVVLDRQTGDPLVGALVFLEGTQIGMTCDVEGRFQLFEVPSGTYVLASSMIGYQDASIIGVEVQDGEVAKLVITLMPEALEIDDEVIVEAKALRNTGAALLKERQKAPAVSDAISAEEIARAGSGDAAEAMAHVPGASVVGGKYVYIRGLGDRYSSVQLNGSSLPNADPDKRAIPMDLFPTSLLDNIVTTKSFTPDKPGDFTGGSVNIGTKAFPDHFTLSVSASTKFNTQSSFNDQFLTYEGGGLDWIGIDDGTREIPTALATSDAEIPDVGAAYNDEEKALRLDEYSKSFSSVMAPTTAPAPLNQSYSVALGNQVSLLDRPVGFLGTLSYSNSASFYDNGTSARWQLTSKEARTLTNNFNLTDTRGAREIAWGSLVTLSIKPSPTHELSATNLYNRNSEDVARYLAGAFPRDLEEDALYETRVLQFTERQIQSLQLAGKHYFSGLHDLRAEWSASASASTQVEPDLRFFTNNYVTKNRPLRGENGEVLRDENDKVIRGPVTDYSISPSIYPLPTRYFRDLDESNREFQLNLTYPFKQWQGINSHLKTGFLALDKQRAFRERRYEFDQDDINYDGQPNTFFEAEKVGLTSRNGRQYRFGSYVQDATQLSSNFDGDQQIYAGYAMLELPINTKLRLVGGTRLEATRIDVASQDPTKTAGRLAENDLLPSLNAVWEIRPGMNVRTSYGRTLARPTFRELAPFASFSFVGGFTFIGNAELERTLIDNYDLRWEHFGRPGELYAASVFYKDFKNPIERVILTVNGEVQFQNVATAQVSGVEFEGRHSLGFLLPEHFHAGGNLSLVRSKVAIDATELTLRQALNPQAARERSLQGQSPFLLNLNLSYDNFATGTAAGIYYNMFGRRLAEVSLGGTPDVFEEERGTLDCTFSQQWHEYKIKLSAKNLLDSSFAKAYRYQGTDYIASQYYQGRSFSISLGYNR